MNKLLFEYEAVENDVTTKLEVNASAINQIAAVGALIQSLYQHLLPLARVAFRLAINSLVSDDSPVWKPSESKITVDLNELRKQAAEEATKTNE